MTRYSKIRFVGGPWHNRVVCVELLPVFKVWDGAKCLAAVAGDYAPRPEAKYHDYLLRTFRSGEEDADGLPELVFQQYVHASLCPDPPAWASNEVGFAPLPDRMVARFDRMLARTSLCKMLCGGGRKRLNAD